MFQWEGRDHESIKILKHKNIDMSGYKDQLKLKMDVFVHGIFDATIKFPREEIYITTSQLKRAALSIILNYTEGYARFKPKMQLNFLETAYGSLKESEYLLDFSLRRNFIDQTIYDKLKAQIDEIGAMLWTEISSLQKSVDE